MMTPEDLGAILLKSEHIAAAKYPVGTADFGRKRLIDAATALADAVADVVREECKKAIRDLVDDDFDEEESDYDCGFREGQDVLSESACAVIDAAAKSGDTVSGK